MDHAVIDVFPPRSNHMVAIEQILSVFETVLSERNAVYVSAALTTGRRFSVWRAGLSERFRADVTVDQAEFRRQVVEPNRRELARLVAELRLRHCVVIDPAGLPDVPQWTQPDYRVLWGLVIERYARAVVFADGWQYSNGSAYEYLVAVRSGAIPLDQQEAPLPPERGLPLLDSAVRELRERATPIEFLTAVINDIRARV